MRSVLSCSKEMEEQLDIALKLYKCNEEAWEVTLRSSVIHVFLCFVDKLSEQQSMNGELEKVKIRLVIISYSAILHNILYLQTSSTRDRLVLKDITELREASANRHYMYVG